MESFEAGRGEASEAKWKVPLWFYIKQHVVVSVFDWKQSSGTDNERRGKSQIMRWKKTYQDAEERKVFFFSLLWWWKGRKCEKLAQRLPSSLKPEAKCSLNHAEVIWFWYPGSFHFKEHLKAATSEKTFEQRWWLLHKFVSFSAPTRRAIIFHPSLSFVVERQILASFVSNSLRQKWKIFNWEIKLKNYAKGTVEA